VNPLIPTFEPAGMNAAASSADMILSAKALHRRFDWSVIPELHHLPKNHPKRWLPAAPVSLSASDILKGDDDRPTGPFHIR